MRLFSLVVRIPPHHRRYETAHPRSEPQRDRGMCRVETDFLQSFTDGIRECLPQHPDIDYDFYTAPLATAPLSIEGVYDSIVTANACLQDLKERLHQWDGVRSLTLTLVRRCLLLCTPPSACPA